MTLNYKQGYGCFSFLFLSLSFPASISFHVLPLLPSFLSSFSLFTPPQSPLRAQMYSRQNWTWQNLKGCQRRRRVQMTAHSLHLSVRVCECKLANLLADPAEVRLSKVNRSWNTSSCQGISLNAAIRTNNKLPMSSHGPHKL